MVIRNSSRRRGLFPLTAAAVTALLAGGLVALSASPAAAAAQTLYASPTGSATSNCGQSDPCTLSRAQARVRVLNDSMSGDITVELAGGTYRLTSPMVFTSEDSGVNASNVVRWTAAAGATPVISGGAKIDANWTNSGGVYSTSVASLPAAALNGRQLYVAGSRADRQSDAPSTLGTWSTDTSWYDVTSTAPLSWPNPADVEFVYDGQPAAAAGWTASRCRVASVAAITGGTRITMAQPCYKYANIGLWPNIAAPSSIEGMGLGGGVTLDAGEWYLNRAAKTIHYKPRPNENLTVGGSTVELATSNGLIDATGVKFMEISGLTFEYATWTGASDGAGVVDIQSNLLATDNGTDPDLKADDRNGSVTRTGAWTSQNGILGQYGDTQSFATANSASLTFSFTGTGFEFVSTMAANRGGITYSLDGDTPQPHSCAQTIAADQQTCLSLTGLSAGPHTVTITKTGGIYLSFDAYRVINGSTVTTYDDNPITYSTNAGAADWVSQVGTTEAWLAPLHRKTQSYATRNGASVSYTFHGTGIDYISTQASNRGTFDYTITGATTRSGSGTCYAAAETNQQACLSIRDLNYGQHTITLTKTDGMYMTVDALYKRTPRTAQVPSAIGFHASSNVTITGNKLRHLGGGGVTVDDGSSYGTVSYNEITDTSAAGITIGNGSYNPANANAFAPPRFVDDHATVTYNKVTDSGVEFLGASAITAYWVKNTTISHNDVLRAPYTGITLGWGWGNTDQAAVQVNNHVDYNDVQDVQQSVLHDGGGIYVNGRHQATPRSSVVGNYVDGNPKPYGGIYLDNGASYFDVNNNVVTDSPANHGAIFLTSGGWGNANTNTIGNVVGDNFGSTTTGGVHNPGGANNTIQGTNLWNQATWPAAANAIIGAAGAP